MNLQYQFESNSSFPLDENRSGLRKSIIGAKYLLYDPMKNYENKPNLYSWKANHKFNYRQFIPAVGIYAGVNINLSGNVFARPGIPFDRKISPKVMVLTQNQFGKSVLVINIIMDKISSNKKSLDYVVTLTRGFSPRWSGYIENQGCKSDYYADTFLRGGAAFLIKQNFQVDASIGTNFKNSPSIVNGGIGMSWRFDKNYKEIRIPKEKQSKQQKDKDKKKEKAKKRLDEVEGTKTK